MINFAKNRTEKKMFQLLIFSFIPSCDRRSAIVSLFSMQEISKMKDLLKSQIANDEYEKKKFEDNIVKTIELFPNIDYKDKKIAADETHLANIEFSEKQDKMKLDMLTDLEYSLGECLPN